MKVSIQLSNHQFSFGEQFEIAEEDKEYWRNAEELCRPIEDVPCDHPVYGWMECYGQSDLMLPIDWTFISFRFI